MGGLQGVVLAVLLLAAAHAMAEGLIPLSDFARLPEYETAKISPDGTRLAVVMRRDGRRMVVTLDLTTLDLVGHVNFNPPNEVLHFHWVGNDRLLISLAVTLGALDAPLATGELYAVNADGSQPRLLFGARSQRQRDYVLRGDVLEEWPRRSAYDAHRLMSLLPHDPRNVLVTRIQAQGGGEPVTDVALLDVYTGRMRQVARAPVRGAHFVADRAGHVRFALGHNADLELEMYHRAAGERRWALLNRRPFAAGSLGPVGFAADDRHVYVIDTRGVDSAERTDTVAVRLLDTATGALDEVFQHPHVDVDRVLVAPDDLVVYGVRYVPGKPRYRIFTEAGRYAEIFRTAAARFPDAFLDFTSITGDGRLAVLRVETDRDPGTLYLMDVQHAEITQLLQSRRWLDPERLAPVEPVTFEARDGTTLHGYLTRPLAAVQPARTTPLVVLPHGGPHLVRDDGRFDETVQLLAHHGYAVLQVNFRGSGGYGRRFQEAGYGNWHGLVLDDIEDGVRWAVAAGHADPERICAVGFSFGAYAAAMGAIRFPGRYQCIAGIAGVYDLALLVDTLAPRQPAARAFLQAAVGATDQLDDASPARRASELGVPVLLIHGVEDGRASVQQARRMRDALTALAATGKYPHAVDYLEIPREGHGFYALENRVRSYERLLSFLDRHLGRD
jgi:dipeptidyl aminopeptidase/acylaminoacyl peptidase